MTKELLNYFFLHPENSVFVNEISRKLNLDKRNLVKKLKELEEEGIFKSESRGNQKIYSINKSFPLFNEYKQIVFKTIGIENKLRETLKKVEGVEKVYLFGSYAKNELDVHSDIDLLVIGDHKVVLLQRQINKLQKQIDREINVVNMDKKEFNNRKKRKDAFIETVLREKHIEVI
ncbi:nucleotidyltransferase domain-containing protein [Candidatus Omnitrophota bacterium]